VAVTVSHKVAAHGSETHVLGTVHFLITKEAKNF
jgi:hypothetical protein